MAIKRKLESHKKVCENKNFCNIVMPYEDAYILEFNLYHKSDKAPFTIYVDLQWLKKMIDECKNYPPKSCTTKAGEHIP